MTAVPASGRPRRVAWAASDYWEMTRRSLRHIRHDPEQLGNVTVTPVLLVVLMKYLFGGAISTGASGGYINFAMPGVFIAVAAFAAVTTTVSVAADMREGVIDRFRTMPMARSSVIAGHVIADLARSLIGLGATIAAGYAVGFRPAAGPGGWAAAVAVILLATFALSWIAALIGLGGRSVETAQQLGALVVIPVFVSSALVPAATMPPWLRVITANQPVTQAIDIIRAVLAGQPRATTPGWQSPSSRQSSQSPLPSPHSSSSEPAPDRQHRVDGNIGLRPGDLEVVAQGRVRLREQRPDLRERPAAQQGDRVEDAPVLGDDVPRPAVQLSGRDRADITRSVRQVT